MTKCEEIGCENCFYNFRDGNPSCENRVCANHTGTEDEPDTYGVRIEELKKVYPNGCEGYKMDFETFCEYLADHPEVARKYQFATVKRA
jgi:hypothetical protein